MGIRVHHEFNAVIDVPTLRSIAAEQYGVGEYFVENDKIAVGLMFHYYPTLGTVPPDQFP